MDERTKKVIDFVIKNKLLDESTLKKALLEYQNLNTKENFDLFLFKKKLIKPQEYGAFLKFIKNQKEIEKTKQLNSPIEKKKGDKKTTQAIKKNRVEEKFKIGERFAERYIIQEEIARGGMGIILKAKDEKLERDVAIKILLSGGAASPEERARFERESETMGKLHHPNIISIYERGEFKGIPYFVMEFIEGETLQTLLKKKNFSKKTLLKIVKKIAEALDYAHSNGVIHRDIKPSNIIINKEGEPILTDFGLAKKIDSTSEVTKDGTTVGTPYYMSPEQALGTKEIDGRTDIYSLGVILYEILAKRLPFYSSSLVELYHKIIEDFPVEPSKINRTVDKELEAICLKAMEKDPAARYQRAIELAEDIERYLKGEPVKAKKYTKIGIFLKKIKKYKKDLVKTAGIGVTLIILLSLIIVVFIKISKNRLKYNKAKELIKNGKIFLKNKKYDKSLAKFSEAIKIYPSLPEAYFYIGKIYLEKKDPQNALICFENILKKFPNHYLGYYGKGLVFLKRGKINKAIKEFKKTIKENPNFIGAYVKITKAYEESKENLELNIKKTLEYSKIANKLKNKIILKGDRYLRKGNYEKALELYESIIEADPSYSKAYYKIGLLYYKIKSYHKAIKNLEEAIKKNEDYLKAYQLLYRVYLKLYKLEKDKRFKVKYYNKYKKYKEKYIEIKNE